MKLNPCRCHGRGRKWCWIDWLTRCHIGCDRHDNWITGAR